MLISSVTATRVACLKKSFASYKLTIHWQTVYVSYKPHCRLLFFTTEAYGDVITHLEGIFLTFLSNNNQIKQTSSSKRATSSQDTQLASKINPICEGEKKDS